ncbi:MAG: membrane-associated phospholipid phosphatase [Vicingaceae bacterium]
MDEPINDYFTNNKTHFQDHVASFGDFMGQPEYQGPFLVVFWGEGMASNNEWIRTTSNMLAASIAASGLIQTFSKAALGRARPSSGDGNSSFKPFWGKNYHSFPSGHTMLSISSSWIMARQVKYVPLKIVFYTIPAVVGWSRLYDNAHWFSDIVLGSALGIASAEAVIRYYSTIKKKDHSQAGLTVLLISSTSICYQ